MILVMKLSAFGWNIHDGKQPRLTLNDFNKARAITKHPNVLPYIGYVFYASLLTGPAFDYADYDKFIHGTLFDDVPQDKRPGKTKEEYLDLVSKHLKSFCWGSFGLSCYFKVTSLSLWNTCFLLNLYSIMVCFTESFTCGY